MLDEQNATENSLAIWLAENFQALPSVRRSRMNANSQLSEPPPLVVVDTWMQATLFVYALAIAPAMRTIRRLLTHNTRAGLGSVFLLHRANYPDSNTLIPPPWLSALSALGRERLFTYSERAGVYTLDQLRLQPSGLPGEFKLLWRNKISLQRLAVSERVISNGPLRGRWLGADLDCENQKADYAAAARVRRAPLPNLDPITRECFSLLGLSLDASGPEIRKAFRRLARETHPDVSNLPVAEAEVRFRRLQDAYRHILHQRGVR